MNMSLRAALPAPYPFAALISQEPLQQALLLAAVDPGIGGVLVSGPRGTAKSTAARGLAEMLPTGRFVTLPLGASEDRLIGTLDLDEVLRGGPLKFSPGLLAQAHEGVLYVDEVNLLADALVDALLDAAASGVNVVERDGVSHSHEARFVLVGTMNPQEGELRPQLLDRFGLMIELDNCFDPRVRQSIVKARLAFEADPHAFRDQWRAAQQALAQRVTDARAALPRFSFDDTVHEAVSASCVAAAVDGMRADLVMLRSARALAAFEQAETVTPEHVERVAQAVLRHRRRERDAASHPTEPDGSQRSEKDARERRDEPSAGGSGASRTGATLSDKRGGRPSTPIETHNDFGYLPPEPTGMAQVKSVIPLSAGKKR